MIVSKTTLGRKVNEKNLKLRLLELLIKKTKVVRIRILHRIGGVALQIGSRIIRSDFSLKKKVKEDW